MKPTRVRIRGITKAVRIRGVMQVVIGRDRLPYHRYCSAYARPKAVPVILVTPDLDDEEEEYNYQLDDFNFDCAREHAAFHGSQGRD